ncbi:MAG: hypothetical protein CSB28_01745 [Desulfobacterales bacterium]|nr:MAG: hypothetical protein CSB28_01745 [Desulfobacterales bacterium]
MAYFTFENPGTKAMKKGRHGTLHSGFTLMEVVLAMAILGFAVLALSRMQITALGTNQTAWKFTKAAVLATDRMEFLMALGYDDPQFVTGSQAAPPYQVEWEITRAGTMENIKSITVTVSWKEKKSSHEYTLNSCKRP